MATQNGHQHLLLKWMDCSTDESTKITSGAHLHVIVTAAG